jgi:hypothetical protein
MKVGFTGTQLGMTNKQKTRFEEWIGISNITEFHHGDCIGADEEAHEIVNSSTRDITIIIHPPKDMSKRAFCGKGDEGGSILFKPEKPYLDRNHDIVRASTVLIACPKKIYEETRSGTWATIRHAKKCGVMVLIIWPDGLMERWS